MHHLQVNLKADECTFRGCEEIRSGELLGGRLQRSCGVLAKLSSSWSIHGVNNCG